MKVFCFHLMPYAHLDMSYTQKHRAAWVVLPNTYFDPKKGHELYNRYLDELELVAELGFDGISVNEHHQNAYGLMPSPVVMAAALSRRTKNAKIAILGNAFCLREHPLTLAEEHAMIDCITGGRLISGMVRGIGAEYYSMGVNPTISHARFQEAHDLVVQAWTRPGPFAFEGKHYHFEYVNVWPRPYQQPHPPIWAPSTGSTETIEWAAHPSRKYVYLQAYSPITSVARYLNYYRECAQKMYGYAASSDQIGWSTPVYVSEIAEEHAKPQALGERPGAHGRFADRAGHHRLRQPRHGAKAVHGHAPHARLPESAVPHAVRHAAARSHREEHPPVRARGAARAAGPDRQGIRRHGGPGGGVKAY
jgi:alkanesulfonate monooxygenase SsuD/methylene tetrahydromethanopterin reductase-like flavin-dependent oxidoreductase (luciferase family)